MGARFLATVLLVSCMPAGLAGQSLGELARKEKERRSKCAPPAGKVLTEADLARQREEASAKGEPSPGSEKPRGITPTPTATPTPAPPQPQATPSIGYDRRTEQYWRERKARLEHAVRSHEVEVARAQGST